MDRQLENRLINGNKINNITEKSNMWWVFTLNNGNKLKDELENIENKEYQLYIKEYEGDELIMTFVGPTNEVIEIDIHKLSMMTKNVSLGTIAKFAPIAQLALTKTVKMLKGIGR